MNKNKESIQLLRKKGTDDNVTLKYGQPFYNSQKNYLTVGTEDSSKAPNKKTSGRPIAARELVAYNGDTEDNIKTDSDSEPSEKVGSVEFDSFGNLTISRACAGEFTSLNKGNPLYKQLLGDKPGEPGRPGIVLKGRGQDKSDINDVKDLTFYNYLYADDSNGLIICRAHVYDHLEEGQPIRDNKMLTPSLLLMSKEANVATDGTITGVTDSVSMSIAAEPGSLTVTDWASNSDTFTLSLKNGAAKKDGSYGASGSITINKINGDNQFTFSKPIAVNTASGPVLKIGDDAWISDRNIAGCICIEPISDAPGGGIAMRSKSGDSRGVIIYDGYNIRIDRPLLAVRDNSSRHYITGVLDGSILRLYTEA